MNQTTLELPLVPVSFNQTRYAHWRVVQRKARPLQEALLLLLRTSDLQPASFIEAEAILRFKDRRRRDEGNFRTPLEKTLGDVLTREKYLTDDTPDQYRFTRLTFSDQTGPAQTILTLNWRPLL